MTAPGSREPTPERSEDRSDEDERDEHGALFSVVMEGRRFYYVATLQAELASLAARAVAAEARAEQQSRVLDSYKAANDGLAVAWKAAEARAEKAEVENARLTAEASDNCTGCARPTNSVDTFCWVCKLDELEQDCDRLRAEREDQDRRIEELRVALAAVEALLPGTDAEYPILPSEIRAALGAVASDYLLIPRASISDVRVQTLTDLRVERDEARARVAELETENAASVRLVYYHQLLAAHCRIADALALAAASPPEEPKA